MVSQIQRHTSRIGFRRMTTTVAEARDEAREEVSSPISTDQAVPLTGCESASLGETLRSLRRRYALPMIPRFSKSVQAEAPHETTWSTAAVCSKGLGDATRVGEPTADGCRHRQQQHAPAPRRTALLGLLARLCRGSEWRSRVGVATRTRTCTCRALVRSLVVAAPTARLLSGLDGPQVEYGTRAPCRRLRAAPPHERMRKMRPGLGVPSRLVHGVIARFPLSCLSLSCHV